MGERKDTNTGVDLKFANPLSDEHVIHLLLLSFAPAFACERARSMASQPDEKKGGGKAMRGPPELRAWLRRADLAVFVHAGRYRYL